MVAGERGVANHRHHARRGFGHFEGQRHALGDVGAEVDEPRNTVQRVAAVGLLTTSADEFGPQQGLREVWQEAQEADIDIDCDIDHDDLWQSHRAQLDAPAPASDRAGRGADDDVVIEGRIRGLARALHLDLVHALDRPPELGLGFRRVRWLVDRPQLDDRRGDVLGVGVGHVAV